jgi:curved DNA-binding protein CbpA
LKGRGSSFSFRSFGGRPGRVRFEARPGQEINLDEILGQTRRPRESRYELTISQKEAAQGVKKILKRRGKRLEVRIPAGVKTGDVVRFRNALQTSDGLPGDILVKVVVK